MCLQGLAGPRKMGFYRTFGTAHGLGGGGHVQFLQHAQGEGLALARRQLAQGLYQARVGLALFLRLRRTGAAVGPVDAAAFVLVLGRGQDAEYIGAYAGLLVLGAAIATAVNLVLPPLYLLPSELALDRLRDSLVEELDDLAAWLEDEGPLEPDEWERRRERLHPTIEAARSAVARTREASRGNPRARRHGDRTRSQAHRAEVLGTSAGVLDEIVRLLVAWERTGRDDVALGPRLRPDVAAALRSFAAALRAPAPDGAGAVDGGTDGAVAEFRQAVDRLRAAVRAVRVRSESDHLVAGALVVVLSRSAEVLSR